LYKVGARNVRFQYFLKKVFVKSFRFRHNPDILSRYTEFQKGNGSREPLFFHLFSTSLLLKPKGSPTASDFRSSGVFFTGIKAGSSALLFYIYRKMIDVRACLGTGHAPEQLFPGNLVIMGQHIPKRR
jgi:hypothetical protein